MKADPDQTDNSAPEVLEALVRRAENAGASDIHLHIMGNTAQIAFRLDGVIVPTETWPTDTADRVFGRIKFLARLKTYQESLPQDGRIDRADLKCRNDIRVATYPTVTGEKIVLRLFQGAAVRGLGELDFPEKVTRELEKFLRQSAGLLLLTGPAGSGKTTTIYACLRHLADMGGRHVITVEDPAEQVIPGVMQTETNEARGLTFAKAARHLLRQDPEVLVIGEIRDDETANIAVRAALTGHLVISTLHAGSCRGVVERLLTLCPDRYAVVAGLELIVNQRLIRRLCPMCEGAGCASCVQTGYRGRAPVVEWVRIDEPIRRQLRVLGSAAVQSGHSLAAAAQERVAVKITTPEEFERVFGAPAESKK